MATPQKPVFFDGRQLRRASSTNPIDTDVLETDVVVTDGSRGFTGPVTGVDPVSDAGLTPRLYVNHMIADGFWAYPVESIRNVPPVGPLNEQRWIVGATPTGVWAGHANSIAAYRNAAWVFIPAVTGVFVFNKAMMAYIHYTGSTWSTIGGLGTVTSVGLVLPSSEFNITFSPVTGFGDLTAEWKTQAPGTVFAGPLGATPGVPGFRALDPADIPALGWDHITTGLPTTLAGYGITDGALNGDIKASGLTMAASRLLGRVTAAVGAVEEISVGAGLALAGGILVCTVTGSSLNATQVGYGSSLNELTGSPNLVYDDDIGTGGLSINNATATTDALTGALLVAGGVSLGADLRVAGDLILSEKAANLVFASPNGIAGIPGFRGLVVADVSGAAVDTSVVHLAGTETITGIKTFTAAITSVGDPLQDGIRIQGRAGGTLAYMATLTPGVLTGSHTYTLPDKTGTIAMTSDVVVPSLPATQVGFGDSDNLLTGSANFTYVSNLSTGGLTIANTTDATSTTTGALKVAGGIGVAKSVVAGGALLGSPITFIGSTSFSAGVYATSGTGNSKFALYGYSIITGSSAQNAGIYGFATATGGTPVRQIGLIGKSDAFAGVTSAIIGVYGGGDYTSSPNATYSALTNKSAIGIMGVRTTSAVPNGYVTNIGIYGEASGATNNYAGYFVGAVNTVGTITAINASTQDALCLQGRAGGTSSFVGTLIPTALGASRTYTLPDKDGTVAMTSDIVSPSLTATYVGFGSSGGLLTGSAKVTWDDTNVSLKINGTGGTLPTAPTGGAGLQVGVGSGNAAVTRILADVFMGTGGGFASYSSRAARGTVGSPSALQSGDEIAHLSAWGYGATGYSAASRGFVSIFTAENWTDAAQGTHIALWTTTPGTLTTTEKIRIWGDGGLQLGGAFSTSPGPGALSVTSTTASTSTTTGGLVVAGGVGVQGALYVGSDVSVGGTLIIKNVNEAVNAIGNTGAGTVTVNCLTANRVTLTVTGISTLAFSNVPAAGTAKTMVLHITNGGAFALSFPTGTRWAGGIAPALMASGLDIIGLTTIDGGTTWDGVPMSLNSKVP